MKKLEQICYRHTLSSDLQCYMLECASQLLYENCLLLQHPVTQYHSELCQCTSGEPKCQESFFLRSHIYGLFEVPSKAKNLTFFAIDHSFVTSNFSTFKNMSSLIGGLTTVPNLNIDVTYRDAGGDIGPVVLEQPLLTLLCLTLAFFSLGPLVLLVEDG